MDHHLEKGASNVTAQDTSSDAPVQSPQPKAVSPSKHITPKYRWGVVKKHVVAMSAAKRIAEDNVPTQNKMGVYAWDEVNADDKEFSLAVCFQLGLGTLEPTTSERLRTVQFKQGDGFEGRAISAFSFEEHSPAAFASIRDHFSMPLLKYKASLALHDMQNKTTLRVVNRSQASGKSSSWFFFSSDMRFAIKTCTTGDFQALKRILNSYSDHVKEPTLLPKYFGLYTLSFANERITFVVMNNVFAGYLDIHLRYDLKGSTAGRRASAKERAKKHCVLKDLDLMEQPRPLVFGDRIRSILSRDAKWLAKQRVMDYSLLVGMHIKENSEFAAAWDNKFIVPPEQRRLYENGSNARKAHEGVVTIETPDFILYLGIVDILTLYGPRKRAETIFTGTLVCRDASCQPPRKYANRFYRFFEKVSIGGEVDVHGLD